MSYLQTEGNKYKENTVDYTDFKRSDGAEKAFEAQDSFNSAAIEQSRSHNKPTRFTTALIEFIKTCKLETSSPATIATLFVAKRLIANPNNKNELLLQIEKKGKVIFSQAIKWENSEKTLAMLAKQVELALKQL